MVKMRPKAAIKPTGGRARIHNSRAVLSWVIQPLHEELERMVYPGHGASYISGFPETQRAWWEAVTFLSQNLAVTASAAD
jgi:hypothetical protein